VLLAQGPVLRFREVLLLDEPPTLWIQTPSAGESISARQQHHDHKCPTIATSLNSVCTHMAGLAIFSGCEPVTPATYDDNT